MQLFSYLEVQGYALDALILLHRTPYAFSILGCATNAYYFARRVVEVFSPTLH
jgi:hypothetical protein